MPDLLRRVRNHVRRRAWGATQRIRIASRGDRDAVIDALLRLVRRGEATATEQRRLRHLTDTGGSLAPGDAAGPGRTDPTPPPPAGGSAVLTVSKGSPSRFSVGDRTLATWRPAWATLSPALIEQLATCSATLQARDLGVTAVRGTGDPVVERAAAAVAGALGVPHLRDLQ